MTPNTRTKNESKNHPIKFPRPEAGTFLKGVHPTDLLHVEHLRRGGQEEPPENDKNSQHPVLENTSESTILVYTDGSIAFSKAYRFFRKEHRLAPDTGMILKSLVPLQQRNAFDRALLKVFEEQEAVFEPLYFKAGKEGGFTR